MSPLLHDYIAGQLGAHLRASRIVVWYDPRSEFLPFVSDLGASDEKGISRVEVAGVPTVVATHDGSLYSMRQRVESLVDGDNPDPLLLYLPGVVHDSRGSILMELEMAGMRWEPQLRQLGRHALKQRFTDGIVDELLARDVLDYRELANAAATDESVVPSVLKSILGGNNGNIQLALWLAQTDVDAIIAEKQASSELRKLVSSKLGIELPDADLAKWRAIVMRLVLGVEFQSDLAGGVPAGIESLPVTSPQTVRNARAIAETLRAEHSTVYPLLSDQVAAEFGLDILSVDPLHLGAIDTFRFEEASLLVRCGELVCEGRYQQVLEIAEARGESFWLTESIDRQSQWEAIRLVATLGEVAERVEASMGPLGASLVDWIDHYATDWCQVDRAQRQLEAWLPKLEDDPDERALAHVRRRYDVVLGALASGFAAALKKADWVAEEQLLQTSVYDDVVRKTPGRVAFLVVDAMRYEMGVELAERLEGQGEVTIRPALGVLPSITTMGMAALMPGASATFSATERGGKLAAEVDGAILADLKSRKKHMSARVPSSVDLELAEVHSLSKSRLSKKVGEAELILVRSQEIDFFGEGGFQARTVMDTVIDNLARAVRKLAAIGIERAVIAADHGHLFACADRDESMRIDAPGGETVEIHRRCWIGRGGSTPAASMRVTAQSFGYDSDLDFVFPTGIGVFRSGGDLAYHHGGASPQEMIVPIITVRSRSAAVQEMPEQNVAVGELPATITNRIFSIKISLASLLGEGRPVKPVLLSDGNQVGTVGIAHGADLDRSSGTVVLASGVEATVGFVLDDDEAKSIRVVVLDPATDAELYRSPADIPVRLGVS